MKKRERFLEDDITNARKWEREIYLKILEGGVEEYNDDLINTGFFLYEDEHCL